MKFVFNLGKVLDKFSLEGSSTTFNAIQSSTIPFLLYALAPLDEFPKNFLENEENSSKFRFVAFGHKEVKKEQPAREILENARGKDQRNFLAEPKQEILKMCYFPRIKRKFQWNQHQKVLILISANQFSCVVTQC